MHHSSRTLYIKQTTDTMDMDDKPKAFQDVSTAEGSVDISLDVSTYIDPKNQKKLLLKLDLYLAPIITLIFLCAYLDRSNIGNAQAAGMGKDLGLVGNQYGSKFKSCIGEGH
jgi:hypothetical protein